MGVAMQRGAGMQRRHCGMQYAALHVRLHGQHVVAVSVAVAVAVAVSTVA